MHAAFYEGKGTIVCRETPEPKPGPGQVKLKIAFCGICGTDLHVFEGRMDKRVTLPQVIGHECSGTIVEVGEGVAEWKPGDRAVVRPLAPCGHCIACRMGNIHICHNLKFIGVDTPGALQNYWVVDAYTLHRIPDSMSLRDAALVEPLAVACHDVKYGNVADGENMVVIGGGPIGILISLVGRSRGARILVAEVAPERLKLAQQLGFETLDSASRDLVEFVPGWTNGDGADVAFEVSGSDAGALAMTRILRAKGRIVMVAMVMRPLQLDMHKVVFRELTISGARVYEKEDFETALKLVAEGYLPVEQFVTDIVPLAETQSAFEKTLSNPAGMKTLIDCSA